MKSKTIARILLLFILLFIAAGTLIFRSDYISEKAKEVIVAEIKKATEREVGIKKVTVNFFPPFVTLEDVTLYDKDGRIIVFLKKVKGKINPIRLFKKEIMARKLDIDGFAISVERYHDGRLNVIDVFECIKRYVASEQEIPLKLVFKNIELESGTFNLTDKDILVEGKIDSQMRVRDNMLWFDQLKVAFDTINKLNLKGKINTTTSFLDLDFKATLSVPFLTDLLKKDVYKDEIDGVIDVVGKIEGNYPELNSKGTLTLNNGRLLDKEVKKFETAFSFREKRLSLYDFSGNVMGGSISGDAGIIFEDPAIYWVKVDLSGLKGNDLFPGYGSFLSSVSFHIDGRGSGGNLRGNSWLKNVNTSIAVSGDVNLKTGALSLSIEGNTDNIGDFIDPAFKGVRGSLSLKGEVSGAFKEPSLRGDIILKDGQVKGVPVHGVGEIQYTRGIIKVHRLTLKQGEGVYSFNGDIDLRSKDGKLSFAQPRFNATVKMNNCDPVAVVMIVYKGLPIHTSVDGQFNFKGGFKDFEGKGTLSLRGGEAYGQGFDRATISVVLKTKEIEFPSVMVFRENRALKAKGRMGFNEQFDAEVQADRVKLSDIDAVKKNLRFDSAFSLSISGRGSFDSPVISGKTVISKLTHKKRDFGGGLLEWHIEKKRLNVILSLLDKGIRGDIEMQFIQQLPWKASVVMNKARLDPFINEFSKTDGVPQKSKDFFGVLVTGKIDANGYALDMKTMSLMAEITSLSSDIYGYRVINDGPITFNMKGGNLRIGLFRLKGEGTSLDVDGWVKVTEGYNLNLNGGAELVLLRLFSSEIEQISGSAQIAVAISGKWENPDIQGGVIIQNGVLKFKGMPQRIAGLRGEMVLDKNKIVLENLMGGYGRGGAKISGVAYLKGFIPYRFYAQIAIKDIDVMYPEGLNMLLDGDIIYEGTPKTQRLSGDIKVVKAVYNKRIEWKSWLIKLTRRQEPPRTEVSTFGDTELNLRLTGKENIWIDNNVAKTPITADLIIRGTVNNPQMLGRLTSSGGTVFFRSNEFRIISATADFIDPKRIYPVFNLNADSKIRNYLVRLVLSGHLDRFDLSLTSDPPLSDQDILALLTVGQTSKGLRGIEAGVSASEAASFVTGKIQDVIEERLKDIVGFDRFQIDPYVSRSVTSGSPRVTVGKRLLADKLYVTYSTNIGSAEEQLLQVEYIFSKRFSLIGIRDEQGQVGGDIKFRLEFR
ncbi:MAG: translocation/assembly module TamB domain-containing protein [Nitrospirota bacterium]